MVGDCRSGYRKWWHKLDSSSPSSPSFHPKTQLRFPLRKEKGKGRNSKGMSEWGRRRMDRFYLLEMAAAVHWIWRKMKT